ncbi:DUF4097 family beta strand repeat-containing protein [Lysobacter fragariae]
MTRTHARLAIAVAAALFAIPAQAATPINETRPLDASGHLQVENVKGRIDVTAWDRDEVKIEGSLGAGVEKLEISGDRNHLVVKVKYPKSGGMGFFTGSDKSEPSQLKLMVPRRADLEVDAVSADVDVNGVAPADLSIDSVSGDIDVIGAPKDARIDSVSGDLRLTLNSSSVRTESVSGDIQLRGRLDGEVSVETVSGDVDVAVHESSLRKLSGNTVSGEMNVTTALAPHGRISLESVSGSLDLRVPATLSAQVSGKSFSGDLSAPGTQIDRPKHGPGSSFEHTYGSGDGEIRLESFSGDARLSFEK